jgi:hypothetical protein
VFHAYAAPNQALEPTASSFGFAYASGGGSPRALCLYTVHPILIRAVDHKERYCWWSIRG